MIINTNKNVDDDRKNPSLGSVRRVPVEMRHLLHLGLTFLHHATSSCEIVGRNSQTYPTQNTFQLITKSTSNKFMISTLRGEREKNFHTL